MGGYIAWQFVEHHPSKLAALIVCDSKAAPDSAEARQARLESAARLEQEGTDFLASSMLPKLFGPQLLKQSPDYVKETSAVILRTDPKGCAAAQRGMAERVDYRPHLGNIQVPTLIVCGERDVISPPEEMRQIAAAIPQARYAEIAGASHMSPLEMPEPVNTELAAFLATLA
jgi:pimeloyl-ACP methyl ester carboxylesterase